MTITSPRRKSTAATRGRHGDQVRDGGDGLVSVAQKEEEKEDDEEEVADGAEGTDEEAAARLHEKLNGGLRALSGPVEHLVGLQAGEVLELLEQ